MLNRTSLQAPRGCIPTRKEGNEQKLEVLANNMEKDKPNFVYKTKSPLDIRGDFCSSKIKPTDKTGSNFEKSNCLTTDGSTSNTINKEKSSCLSIDATRKMIRRFLDEKQISMEQLAKNLKIEAKKLEQIFSSKASLELVSEINLPLIELYCATDWKLSSISEEK